MSEMRYIRTDIYLNYKYFDPCMILMNRKTVNFKIIIHNSWCLCKDSLANLKKLCWGKLRPRNSVSLKCERRQKNIKSKKAVVNSFLKYTSTDSWRELQERFPRHTTESKLAQFKGLAIKKKYSIQQFPLKDTSNYSTLLCVPVQVWKSVHNCTSPISTIRGPHFF